MGHRANYAIREQGRVSLHYSHWGALTVPEDVFWGPRFAEAFVRGLEPADEWLRFTAEGGVGLCKDTRRCALFGGDRIGHGAERTLLLQMMRATWPGWDVTWVDDLRGVAECVGVPAEEVVPKFLPPRPDDASRLRLGRPMTLIVVTENGVRRVLGLDSMPPNLLAHGTKLFELLDLGKTIGPRDAIFFFLEIDRDRRWIRYACHADEAQRAWLAAKWPEWSLEPVKTPAARVALELGLEVPASAFPCEERGLPPGASREACVALLSRTLLGVRADPAAYAAPMLEALAASVGELELFVNPNVLTPPLDPRPNARTAKRIFALALAAATSRSA
ncbi:MAG: hypothetical protein H6721_04290 [Sandaracinus sp.]|nr:hypothetical protein [Sandaracinus sp.]